MVRGDLSLTKNPFKNANEDTEEFLLVDFSNDEDDFIDIL